MRSSDAPTDKAIIARVRRGERDAFGVLVERYANLVFAITHAQLGLCQDTEDIA